MADNKILVEDEEPNRKFIKINLEREGFIVWKGQVVKKVCITERNIDVVALIYASWNRWISGL